MLLHLLDLPTELLEHILLVLCQINAQSIQACRQTCHTLNATITQSKLVQYLERLALLGLYDTLPLIGGSATTSASPALPDRVAALRAWEGAWDSLAGSGGVGGGGGGDHDSDAGSGVFWQNRKPDLRVALPPKQSSSWPYSPRVKYIVANIPDPEPLLEYQVALDVVGQHGYLDDVDHFSLGPWFVAATRHGLDVRASYSYLDLHGCLGGGTPAGSWDGDGDGDGDVGDEYDRVFWTVIKIPLWNVVAFAISTELDLVVVISCVVDSV